MSLPSRLAAAPVSSPPGHRAWHALHADQTAQALAVDPAHGLSHDEARRRFEEYGPNLIPEAPPRSPLKILLSQFTDFMILVLLAAAGISALIGDLTDMAVILLIIVLNGVIGFVQEYRAEAAVTSLRKLAPAGARVLRNGREHAMASTGIVRGDIVLIEAGDKVPADLRLIQTSALLADESALTGESVSVAKHDARLDGADLALGDRVNMLYKGTILTHGTGRGIAVATGRQTELGRIQSLLTTGKPPVTPLQQRLAALGHRLALAAIVICAIVFIGGVVRGLPTAEMLLLAISLAVAAIPEALPAVVTVALALGARRMARAEALIRHLPAVETLGSVTFICSDKTGTLTLNRMQVRELFIDEKSWSWPPAEAATDPVLERALEIMALCNNATWDDESDETLGDPTEVALARAAANVGFRKPALESSLPRVLEVPFDSDRKSMTTIHRRGPGSWLSLTKGAPEVLLFRCTAKLSRAGVGPLDTAELLEKVEKMASEGLRVLALCYREWEAPPPQPLNGAEASIESQLILAGLVGLLDPPRPEARQAVDDCKSAGIIPVMITGDHLTTAKAIAKELEITDDGGLAITGPQLSKLSDEQFAAQVQSIRVYARASPEQKIRIVRALQTDGECVAMTGDGVNDAPALRQADIGVAMGRQGTDVAREAAQLVLLDDHFETIVQAVREGRRIYDNIVRFITFVLAGNTAELLTVLVAPLLGLPIPLLPIQILWINLITDGLPGIALAQEPTEAGVMRRGPRSREQSVFAEGVLAHIALIGLLIASACIASQVLFIKDQSWQTIVFTVLAFSQMAHSYALRSDGPPGESRPWLLFTIVITVGLQLLLIYVPKLNAVFSTRPLTARELAFCMAVSVLPYIAVRSVRAIRKKLQEPQR